MKMNVSAILGSKCSTFVQWTASTRSQYNLDTLSHAGAGTKNLQARKRKNVTNS